MIGSWSTSWRRLTSLELGNVELNECGKKAACRQLMQEQLRCFCSQACLGRERGVNMHGSGHCAFLDLGFHPWEVNGVNPSGWLYLCLMWRHAHVALMKNPVLSSWTSCREFMRHDMRTLSHERINQLSETGSGKWGPSWNKFHSEYDCWLNWGFGW